MTLADSDLRKWSGRSEFYGLFLAFGLLDEASISFNVKQRAAIAKALAQFRIMVDQAKKKTNTRKYPKQVRDYVESVTRAATDGSRRELRIRTLEAIMKKAIAGK